MITDNTRGQNGASTETQYEQTFPYRSHMGVGVPVGLVWAARGICFAAQWAAHYPVALIVLYTNLGSRFICQTPLTHIRIPLCFSLQLMRDSDSKSLRRRSATPRVGRNQ